jgi:formylglycine-generating enzyme required for sulfatase activity
MAVIAFRLFVSIAHRSGMGICRTIRSRGKCISEWPELHALFQNGPEPVGSFEPNSFGIHDMGMNVHEWCSDWYDPVYYKNSPVKNPKGPAAGSRRSSRGGSWRHQIKITRCAARSSIPPDFRYADYGFRLVRELEYSPRSHGDHGE